MDYSPWNHRKLDTAEQLTLSLLLIKILSLVFFFFFFETQEKNKKLYCSAMVDLV